MHEAADPRAPRLGAERRQQRPRLEVLQRDAPKAVLLDLGMPVMDGWTFLRECRACRVCDGVPIVVMSAGHRAAEATQLGASDFIAKPFDVDVLLAKLAGSVRGE